jgi:DsbC/DsbD-like thiol-disulfide interchange protein
MSSSVSAGLLAFAAFGSLSTSAGVATQPDLDGSKLVKVSIATDHAIVAPGQTFDVGVRFVIEPEWHIYWDGQNESGMPVAFEWASPTGWAVGEVRWPCPVRHVGGGDILDYVFERQVTALVRVTVPKDAKPGDVRMDVKADYLVCKEACLPGSASVGLGLRVADVTAVSVGADVAAIQAARERLPVDFASDAGLKAVWEDRRLSITAVGATRIEFYPHESGAALPEALRQGTAKGGTLTLDFGAEQAKKDVVGMLRVWTDKGERTYSYRSPMGGGLAESGGKSR